MIREQIESVEGKLKWISSERQFGDGFTKIAARQLLADRMRYGSIKFTWDPEYQASKKKTAAEREKSRTEFSTTLQSTTTSPTTTQHHDRDDDGEHDGTTPDETVHATNELVPNLTFENAQLPENAQLTAEIFETEEIFQTEETYVPTNAQVPVESYAMSHGGGCSSLIKYVLATALMSTADASVLETVGQCQSEDAPLVTPSFPWLPAVLALTGMMLSFLFHYLVTKQLKEEVRSLREQNAQLSLLLTLRTTLRTECALHVLHTDLGSSIGLRSISWSCSLQDAT